MLILASESPRRLALLAQIGVVPDQIEAAAIDETPLAAEPPLPYVVRMARQKAEAVAKLHPSHLVLAADTCVVVGRNILPKAEEETTARHCLTRLSGRRHTVLTAVALIDAQGMLRQRVSTTRIRFMPLTPPMIEAYLRSGEWQGKAGGYAIQGRAAAFVTLMQGSYSGVVGLPLHVTMRLLTSAGSAPLNSKL